MTVTEQSSRKVILGAGWSNPLTHAYVIENAAHVHVFADDVELTQGVDYTVTNVLNPAGYAVTVAVPGSWAPDVWVLDARPPIDQQKDLTIGGTFGAKYEDGLDKVARRLQYVWDLARRGVKTSPSTPVGDDPFYIPSPEADTLIGWDASGTSLENKLLAMIGAVQIDDDANLTANSSTRVASQRATRVFALSLIAALGMPAPAANAFLQRNAGNTAYDAKTPAQVSSVLYMVANAKLSGCAGDNTADDTAAINALLTSGVKRFKFPAGVYKMSSTPTMPAYPIYIEGDGSQNTIFRQTGAAANGFLFDFASLVQGGGVSGITIEAGTGWKTGGFQGSGSTGTGLRVKNSNGSFFAHDFSVNNFDGGLEVSGGFYPQFTSFEIMYCTTFGIKIDKGASSGAGRLFHSGKVSNFGFTGTNTASYGILVNASGGDYFGFIDVTSFNKCIGLVPTATEDVLYCFFDTVLGDTAVTNNWEFDGTLGKLWGISLTNCWGSFSTNGAGVVCKGANLDDITWVGGKIRENGTFGVDLQGGVNVSFTGTSINSNSKASANTSAGVNVATGVSSFGFLDCRIGNFASTLTGQAEGIVIAAGASQNFRIEGCDLSNAGVGKVPIANGSSVTNWIIRNNLPILTAGTNTSSRSGFSAGTGGTGVAVGTTAYLGPAGQMANVNDAPFVAAKGQLVSGFYVAVIAAPGAAQTFTYTVYKNGVATGMTGTISGAAAFSVLVTTNAFTIAATDAVVLQLVTSAGAAVTKHRYAVYLED